MAPPAQSHRFPSPSQPSGKGEVSDLKTQLRKLAGSRAPGIDDTKREFSRRHCATKMCCLYVGNYAKHNPDLALLTINFLQRECKDEDPMIGGLALRSLSSLGVAYLVENLVGPLSNGLKDGITYLRMVAAVGVLKLYLISASTCLDAEFPALLKHLMLKDKDAQETSKPQALGQHMQGHSIISIASGGQAPNFKFFFFAQKAEESSSAYLVECVINLSSYKVQLKIKADDQSTSHVFAHLFQSALSKFGSS